ncbi:MAG: 1-acyl-sn-glycerol-3-phosphate acyltransferase [Saprospiraceae bacterium]|nr:1-acyl-sn-glycerol-3-phosphate acyltransferase [Saprospiraceae bacterium]
MQFISRLLLRLWGWRIEGAQRIRRLPKTLIAVVPHTSNWDFLLGLLVRSAAGLDTYYLGKKSLFRPPFGFLFRWLGGYPVDRSKHKNQVDAIVSLFNSRQRFSVAIAPEGTRKKVDQLRSGFYFIALKAGIPIILTTFDGENRLVTFSEPFYPTGEFEEDMRTIEKHFSGIKGIVPENSFVSKQ